MREAIRLSQEKMRAGCGGPFGAIVVREGKLISRGWNRVTTAHDPTAHAEISAIREACRVLKGHHLRGCEIYSSCEPCPMCLAAIYWARIDKLYYAGERQDAAEAGFDDALLYREFSQPWQNRTLAAEQLLRAEALPVFEEWKAKPDKTPY